MSEKKEERQVLTELIELYRDLPCLWDLSCEDYKDQDQKSVAWEILVAKLKTIDPNANVASAKQKIENLKSSYKREVKKVKDSKKRTGSGAHEVHKPTLWYYDLMQFLEKKDELLRRGMCTLSSDDESQDNPVVKKRGHSSLLERKKQLIETAQDVLKESKKKTHTFGLYVGEQLESLSSHQRKIAEKLISDVLFLGKTENLNFYSKVESNNTQCSFTHSPEYITSSPQYNIPSPQSQHNTPIPQYVSLPSVSTQINAMLPQQHHAQYIAHSPQYTTPSPQYTTSSPQYNIPCPQSQHTTPIPQYISLPSVSSQTNVLPRSSTQPTNQSTRYSSPSQHQTQPTENPTIVQISIPSPPLPQTFHADDEENSQSIIEGPAGTLLKELLIFKSKQK